MAKLSSFAATPRNGSPLTCVAAQRSSAEAHCLGDSVQKCALSFNRLLQPYDDPHELGETVLQS